MIHVIVSITVKPERLGEFLATARASQAVTLHEPDCIFFDILRDVTDPYRFALVEEWRSRDALIAHRAMPHYRTWREAIASIEAVPRECREFEPVVSDT